MEYIESKMFSPLKKIMNALFPPLCLSCEAPLPRDFPLLCGECALLMRPRGEFVCSSCGKRSPGFHHACHYGSIPVFAAFPYEDPVARRLIHALKYKRAEAAAKTIAFLATPLFTKALPKAGAEGGIPIILVPIPLAKGRERERGYNQSGLIAEAVAEELRGRGLRAEARKSLLRRVRDTGSQTACKDEKERRENVKRCFFAEGPGELENALLFLVDDVVTSGATIEEAARTLKNAGVPHIAGLAIAKT